MEMSVKAVFSIVGMLALAAMIVIFALQLTTFAETDVMDWVNIDYPTVLSGEGVGSFAFTDLDFDEEHTTATEVACSLAQTIRKDFLKYGYGNERPDGMGGYRSLTPIEPRKTIVEKGTFKIKWNSEGGNFWKFEDLPAEMQDGLMVEGVCSDDDVEWKCSTPYFDEECVANALGHMKVGDNFLCTGKKNAKISAGGAIVHFGNDDCGGNKGVADGTDNCNTLCQGGDKGDKIKVWRAPGEPKAGKVTDYADDTEWDTSKEWPPYQCRSDKCEPLYAWILMWNKEKGKKHYEIDIGRIPERTDLGGMTTDALVDKLLAGDHKSRNMNSAFPYPELRTRYDVTFNPTNEETLTGFLTKLEDKLGTGWNAEIEQCFGAECYETAPIKNTWKSVQLKDARWATAPLSYDQSQEDTKQRKKLRKIIVRTEIENPDELLEQNHTYRIVMRWWKVTLDKGWNVPDCGLGVGTCVACLESGGSYVGIRWARDCQGEEDDWGGYTLYNAYRRYQDQALIIMDLGPTEEVIS